MSLVINDASTLSAPLAAFWVTQNCRNDTKTGEPFLYAFDARIFVWTDGRMVHVQREYRRRWVREGDDNLSENDFS